MEGGAACNASDVTFHNCNSNSCHFRQCYVLYPPWLGFVLVLHFVHVMHFISFAFVFVSCIRSFSLLSVSESDTHTCTRCTPQILFREWEKNILGMRRDLSSGLGISSVGFLSNFFPFGSPLMPQRLTV